MERARAEACALRQESEQLLRGLQIILDVDDRNRVIGIEVVK